MGKEIDNFNKSVDNFKKVLAKELKFKDICEKINQLSKAMSILRSHQKNSKKRDN